MSLLSTDITKVKRLSLREVKLPAPDLKAKPLEIEPIILIDTLIEGENSYTREDIIERIIDATRIDQDRAEAQFNSLLKSGFLAQCINPQRYYLAASTPY